MSVSLIDYRSLDPFRGNTFAASQPIPTETLGTIIVSSIY